MSYCRMVDGSDVYVYPSVEGGIVCCACRLTPMTVAMIYGPDWYQDFVLQSSEEMLDHLLIHREFGHTVPVIAIDRLLEEIEESLNND